MKHGLRLFLALVVALGAGLALSSATGAQRASTPSCNDLDQSWRLASEVHIDEAADTAEFVWNPDKVEFDRSLATTRSAPNTSDRLDPWTAGSQADSDLVRSEHLRVSLSERNCTQPGLDRFLDEVADDTASIERGDCALLLEQDRIARAAALPGDLVVGIPSPRAALDGSGDDTITYDLQGSIPVVAECTAILAAERNG